MELKKFYCNECGTEISQDDEGICDDCFSEINSDDEYEDDK